MTLEIIDLTNLPDSPPTPPITSSNVPMIFNYGPVSANPNLHQHIHHHQHQTNVWVPPAPGPTYETPIQITTNWPQPNMLGHISQPGMQSRVTTVLKPLPEPNTLQISNGVRLRVPWTQLEHDLFLMGLIEYGRGKWSKIAKHYVCSKTPQQVQVYGNSFFKHLPYNYVHGFRRKKNMISNTNYSVSKRNRENNDSSEIKSTLHLFHENASLNYNNHVPTYNGGGEAGRSRNNIMNESNFGEFLQMVTGGDGVSTSMTVPKVAGGGGHGGGGNGEVDVELRLSLF